MIIIFFKVVNDLLTQIRNVFAFDTLKYTLSVNYYNIFDFTASNGNEVMARIAEMGNNTFKVDFTPTSPGMSIRVLTVFLF